MVAPEVCPILEGGIAAEVILLSGLITGFVELEGVSGSHS